MKGILALLFLCATSQFAHGHHFSAFRTHHGLLGPKLLGMTASVLSVIGSVYSDSEDTQPEPEPSDDSLEDEDEEVVKQSRALFNMGSHVKKRICRRLCKSAFEQDGVNKTEFVTPNSVSFRFFKTVPKQESVEFRVQASNDAYVALTAGLDPEDPRYEVRLGVVANRQSFITKDKTAFSVATAVTPQILSRDEFRKFWIKWSEGTIRIGKENETLAFLAYADPKLFEVNYLGFGTRLGAQGTWIVQGLGSEAER